MKRYFYKLLARYLSLYIRPEDSVVEVDSRSGILKEFLQNFETSSSSDLKSPSPNYLLLNGNIHYEHDIQGLLERLHAFCSPSTRIVVTYYSSLWKPFMQLADRLGLRDETPEQNWIAHEDMANLLLLSNFEIIRLDNKILIPFWIPIVSYVVNRFLAPLPFFRIFTMVNILVARPVFTHTPALSHHGSTELTTKGRGGSRPSVSIMVPARNEAGNMENLMQRLPQMGPNDELIFVEGHSTDDTWDKIQDIQKKYKDKMKIVVAKQDGKGKCDAVRKGFALASQDILMILDADLTVSPEELPKFYEAIVSGKGEFINGSRLVYAMEKKAMQFLNILGNKFFASAFSFVLGQRFKDTLCGTKVISRENYQKLVKHRSYFGEFDPFGDFDLIFGAARLGLKIVEIPIRYKERTYGSTNINRWKHGALLFGMLYFAAKKMKFI